MLSEKQRSSAINLQTTRDYTLDRVRGVASLVLGHFEASKKSGITVDFLNGLVMLRPDLSDPATGYLGSLLSALSSRGYKLGSSRPDYFANCVDPNMPLAQIMRAGSEEVKNLLKEAGQDMRQAVGKLLCEGRVVLLGVDPVSALLPSVEGMEAFSRMPNSALQPDIVIHAVHRQVR